MEHALGSCDWHLSTNFDVNWEIDFSSNSWSFYVNYTDCFNPLNFSTAFDNVNKIFGFSWLTDEDNSLIWLNVSFNKLSRVIKCNFLESF